MDKKAAEIRVGVVGLGLMGSSITTCLMIAGHPVVALAPTNADYVGAQSKLALHLKHCEKLNLLKHSQKYYLDNVLISEDYTKLQDCDLVIECVVEDPEIKSRVFDLIESQVSKETIIGTNTSAIPISTLQSRLQVPGRFLGIHWAEPAYASRFLEVISGDQTESKYANKTAEIAELWGKEPICLAKDIRGFITNRLMYAMYREGFALWQNEGIQLADLDKSVRYDAGSWMTIMGIFQRMDFEGLDQFFKVTKALFPLLSNSEEVPEIMQEMVARQSRGIYNLDGLFPYTEEEASAWQKSFSKFTEELYYLSKNYLK